MYKLVHILCFRRQCIICTRGNRFYIRRKWLVKYGYIYDSEILAFISVHWVFYFIL
jgi:hypothetical protein